MKLYNTRTKQIEELIPHEEGIVRMYTCGPTVYHYAHIGNLRTYIFEDVLEKALTYLGYDVKRMMNITDVGHMTSDADNGEDKMLKGALREHKTVDEIAQFYTDAFFSDIAKLNIKKPAFIERASKHIETYIKIIEKLIEKGYAYESMSNIYFDVSKIPNYYELSGKKQEELMVGVREDVFEDTRKRNPFDFGLWFTSSKFDKQAMKWDSPWGVGYPGWHIECSGLALTYLGEYLDLHCGGVDNSYPHHSNELAQSEGYLGHSWCKFWCHGEHLNDETGKMSKSKGAFLTISLLEEKGYDPLSYRYFCLQSHYRNQLVFSYDNLSGAQNAYKKLCNKTRNLKEIGELEQEKMKPYELQFQQALESDLNTSLMLTTLYDVLKSDMNDASKRYLVSRFDFVLSLDLLKEKEVLHIEDAYVEEKIKERDLAKQNKDYVLADAIREELKEKGILIKDTREGTIYERI